MLYTSIAVIGKAIINLDSTYWKMKHRITMRCASNNQDKLGEKRNYCFI